MEVIHRFIAVKEALEGRLKRKTAFLFYSESGLSEEAISLLAEAGIWILNPTKLASYEMPPAGP